MLLSSAQYDKLVENLISNHIPQKFSFEHLAMKLSETLSSSSELMLLCTQGWPETVLRHRQVSIFTPRVYVTLNFL